MGPQGTNNVPRVGKNGMFGNRAVWKETDAAGVDKWFMLQGCGVPSETEWAILLYTSDHPVKNWTAQNGGRPLQSLQRHNASDYSGPHIATVDGVFTPKDPNTGLYNIMVPRRLLWRGAAYGCIPRNIS